MNDIDAKGPKVLYSGRISMCVFNLKGRLSQAKIKTSKFRPTGERFKVRRPGKNGCSQIDPLAVAVRAPYACHA
jgi:hypothetical protein